MKRGFVLLGVALNAVMAAVGVDGTGGSSVPGGYGQLLRVHSGLAKPEHRARFWKELDARPGAFNQLALFSPWSEGVAALETHRGKIGDFTAFMEEAHRRGYVAGVNILPGVAFPENFPTQRVAGARNRVNEQGQVQVGTLCLDSQVTRDYIRDLCALYAAAGADFIYLDDDVDLAHCCCPSCCARLSKLAGLDLKDAAAVRAARDGKDLAVRERVRNAWIDFADETRAAVFAAAADGAHAVSPKVGVGCMTCGAANSDRCGALWTKAMKGTSDAVVRWRPGGGNWTDKSLGTLMTKLANNALQTWGVPEDVDVQAELECFPYHGLQKTAGYLGFEALAFVAWGTDSVAYNMLGYEAESLGDEFRDRLDRAQAIAPSLRRLHEAFGNVPATGIAYPWKRYMLTAKDRNWQLFGAMNSRPISFDEIGLPCATTTESTKVLLIDHTAAVGMDEAEVKDALSHGVFLDAAALTALVGRGFGEHLGFKIGGFASRRAGSRDLDHPLNLPGRRKRSIHYSLSSGRENRIALLERTSPKAEFTAEAMEDEKGVGFIGGVFENALGGRVGVSTLLAFDECEGLPRAEHLKRLFRWLSRETLPGYVKSFHRTALRARDKAFYAMNISTDEQRDLELALPGDGVYEAELFVGGVLKERFKLKPVARDGGYSIYRVPVLPNLGSVLLVPERMAR